MAGSPERSSCARRVPITAAPQLSDGATMTLEKLAGRIGARIVAPSRNINVDLEQVYAGDRISDLLNAASDHALLVTNLASEHLVRVAELMDIPAICLVANQSPSDAMLHAAREHGTTLLVSSAGLFETCGRIYAALAEEKRAAE